MIELMKVITAELKKVLSESYHESNNSPVVTYPYLTFDLNSENLEENVEEFYVDIDIFNNKGNYLDIFMVEEELKKHFTKKYMMEESMYVRFNFLRSMNIPTLDEKVKRRHLQLECKVDWRKDYDN